MFVRLESERVLVNVLPTPLCLFFFFNDTATTEIYTLSLHDALPILLARSWPGLLLQVPSISSLLKGVYNPKRSEEHTSELQSLRHLVCRLLLEKKKNQRLPHSAGIVRQMKQ